MLFIGIEESIALPEISYTIIFPIIIRRIFLSESDKI